MKTLSFLLILISIAFSSFAQIKPNPYTTNNTATVDSRVDGIAMSAFNSLANVKLNPYTTNLTASADARVQGFITANTNFNTLNVGTLVLSNRINLTNMSSAGQTAGKYVTTDGSGGVSYSSAIMASVGDWSFLTNSTGGLSITNVVTTANLFLGADDTFIIGQGDAFAGGIGTNSSFVHGFGTATGNISASFGASTVTGDQAFGMGNGTASGSSSVGLNGTAIGSDSFAAATGTAIANSSVSIGNYMYSTGAGSITIGSSPVKITNSLANGVLIYGDAGVGSTSTNTLNVSSTGLTNNTLRNYMVSVTAGTGLSVADSHGTAFITPVLGNSFPLKPGWRFTGTAVTGIAVQFP